MPMYFVQHGLTVEKEVDPDRPLSEEGQRAVEAVAAHLRRMGVAVRQVCHSGKTRARQTAEVLAGEIAFGNISERPGMDPDANAIQFAATVEDDTIYVGHLPHVEKLVSYLTTGREDSGVVRFVNGGVVCVAKDDAGFHIEWFLLPSMCGL